MKPIYKIFVPLFVIAFLAISVVGVAFARHSSEASGGSDDIEIVGVVEDITDSAWKIDGKVYRITTATEIKSLIQPGAQVKVHLYLDANGVLIIREVELAGMSISGSSNSGHDSSGDDYSDNDNSGDDSSGDDSSGDDNSGDDNSGDDSSSDNGSSDDSDDSSSNGDDDNSDDHSNNNDVNDDSDDDYDGEAYDD